MKISLTLDDLERIARKFLYDEIISKNIESAVWHFEEDYKLVGVSFEIETERIEKIKN